MPRLRSRVRDSSPAPVFKVGRKAHPSSSSGEVAKRLCSGLQSRLDGFDSRPRLQMKKIARFRVGYFFCLYASSFFMPPPGPRLAGRRQYAEAAKQPGCAKARRHHCAILAVACGHPSNAVRPARQYSLHIEARPDQFSIGQSCRPSSMNGTWRHARPVSRPGLLERWRRRFMNI